MKAVSLKNDTAFFVFCFNLHIIIGFKDRLKLCSLNKNAAEREDIKENV
jgi:hypothetical protein